MHLTVRMAWHDNDWNGKVCQKPDCNTYCTGAHSLLSGRIEKRKNTEKELAIANEKEGVIQGNFAPDEVPPCYWSLNAFGDNSINIEHGHAFKNVDYKISDILKPYSVFTWPFKLSFIHDDKNKKDYGNYPPDLDARIDGFVKKFPKNESILFFYANYDNPVSADDMKYLLLGCSVVSNIEKPSHFPFTEEELEKYRSSQKMKNFPTMNWAFQVSHNPEKAVLLPYREYVDYVEKNPESEEKLTDIKVIIEEESLIRGFKYVAMDIDDDKCLYLLYKIRKSIKKIQEHKQLVVNTDFQEEEERLNSLIEMVWKRRGIYPSLSKVLNHFIEDSEISNTIADSILKISSSKNDVLSIFKQILGEEIPKGLEEHEDDLLDLTDQRTFKKNIEGLIRLSLFNLTQNQVNKIIKNNQLLNEVARNPYALYEEYVAEEDVLDEPDIQDEPIDVFKVDIGMIPDKRYVKRHRKIQSLMEDSAERIRSVIINYLWHIGEQGHCYDHTYNILTDIYEHPLIYKNNIQIDDNALINLDDDYKSHFVEKLYFNQEEGQRYFYLKSIDKAEKQIKKIVKQLIKRKGHEIGKTNYKDHIEDSLKALSKIITTDEEKQQFREEREQLYKNIFSKSLFLLTGKPGAGKTYETSKVIEHLDHLNEEVLVLAPTGKAALRLTENIQKNTESVELAAKTIDKYIYENGFGWAYDDWNRLESLPESEKLTIVNLVIDESSMIDLSKLKILFSIIRFNDKYPKRIIMVGDENQLPPIGFGKPFQDMITFITSKEKRSDNHYINLKSNCRQENDQKILKLADAFTDKKRYFEEALSILDEEGQVSEGLYIEKWQNEAELELKIKGRINDIFKLELNGEADECDTVEEKMNVLFGLYSNGFVNNQNFAFKENLQLERFQILTPYRSGYYGTIGLNNLIQGNYRTINRNLSAEKYFQHSDKIIRQSNWYYGFGERRKLLLSNGSIGVVTVKKPKYKKEQRKYYFRDLDKPSFGVDSEENFDLAYGITVHKSQGSDFRNVFLVVPHKLSLLSKELIYTALTRSKYRLFLFIQNTEENLLLRARNTSHLLNRNTSIFQKPKDNKAKLFPDPNKKPVRSRIEFIIYLSLMKSGLEFEYEERLDLENLSYPIHPDFTIKLKNGKTIYWEHLGRLDLRKYYSDWQQRINDYRAHDLADYVVTTDELEGIKQERIDQIIEDIREDSLSSTPDNKFSMHHYELY